MKKQYVAATVSSVRYIKEDCMYEVCVISDLTGIERTVRYPDTKLLGERVMVRV